MNITAEIKQITGCTDKEAKKIHAYLLSYFGNLGAVSYSDLRREATHTSLLLKFCKN